MDKAIRETMECYRVCAETIQYCLKQGGKHAEPMHINTLMDCKEACLMAASFMTRNSDMHGKVCGVCADACDVCASSCEEFEDDEQMKKCAEVCRKCEKTCREMAEM